MHFQLQGAVRDHLKKSFEWAANKAKETDSKRYLFEIKEGTKGSLVLRQNWHALDLVEIAKQAVRASFTQPVGGFMRSNGVWAADIRAEGKRVAQIVISSDGVLEARMEIR